MGKSHVLKLRNCDTIAKKYTINFFQWDKNLDNMLYNIII